MIYITYDPQHGKAIRDGDIAQWVDQVVGTVGTEIANGTTEDEIWRPAVGNELTIHALRVAIKQGRVPHTEICFVFRIFAEGESREPYINEENTLQLRGKQVLVRPDKDGRLPSWPVGFCDNFDIYLEALLEP